MQDFILFLELGLRHVLDVTAYDHVLFLAVLTVPYTVKNWKKVLWLVTVFTLGHTISLVLSSYKILEFDTAIIEFLIPVTIFLTAVYNIAFVAQETRAERADLNIWASFFFGLVHGFGFSNYFKMTVADLDSKLMPLLGFAFGVELSQVVVVALVLLLAFVFLGLLKFSRKWWIVVTSVLVLLISIPMLRETWPF
ncbi:MAG: HupE/UreJ family protein [Flavobacteriaceae bacterium]|nr:HupE/UreJ family protein [Flavobacteriaceae bacterium]